jgi:glutamyl-tRNA synthetase
MSDGTGLTVVRTRFAPSPSGDLHLGGAWAALVSWLVARREGTGRGQVVLRIEDLDPPRIVHGSEARITEDLAWLGLDADESPAAGGPYVPYRQSERGALYRAAVAELAARGLVYPCDCSRAEIARVASAPHPGEELVYPGTCRDRSPHRPMRRDPALRLRVPPASSSSSRVTIRDERLGDFTQDLGREVGDFVLVRGDGVFSYQLAVVVDDLAMRITDVVRGADLLASTPRQVALMAALAPGSTPPRYLHVPLMTGADGDRLAKRAAGLTVRELRDRGHGAEAILGALGFALGLTDDAGPRSSGELARLAASRPFVFRADPLRVPAALLA